MADEIKQKISLEGEKEYSAALKEANRNLKTLKSQLKAETAELGNNATAQQKNETRSRSLKKQIEQQEKVVQTLQSALKQAKTQYGDNSDEVAKWEQKLNAARYTLASMNNDLDKTEAELKSSAEAYGDAASAAADYADATSGAEQTADAVTFSGMMTAADNLKSKLTGAISTIKEVATTAWDYMSKSGQWADELTTNSTKWGVDRETLQGWEYAARFVDTDVETIARAFTKLTNRSDSVNKKLEEIGIKAQSGVSAQDLFWEVIEAMESMDDVARENTAMEIFGKSYQSLLPLITAGRGAWDSYVDEAREKGLILSEEQVDALGSFDDANQRLEASFEAMKNTVAAELAPAFVTIADSLAGMVTAFTEWSKTEEGQKALSNLGEAIEKVVDSFTGEQNFTKLVDGATAAIEGLTGALGWISEHHNEVVVGIGGIGAALGALSVSKTVLSALMLIKGIKWTSLPSGISAAGGGSAVETATGAAGGAATGTTAGTILGTAAKAVPWIAGLGVLFGDFFRPSDDHRGEASEIDVDSTGPVVFNLGSGAWENATAEDLNHGAKTEEADEVTLDDEALLTLTEAQRSLAEDYWDAVRDRDFYGQDELAVIMQDLFGDESETLSQLMSLIDSLQESGDVTWVDDLPDWWFSPDGDQLTHSDVDGLLALPEQLETAVSRGAASGTSGLQITMDGYTVARIVAPYVSEIIASEMY